MRKHRWLVTFSIAVFLLTAAELAAFPPHFVLGDYNSAILQCEMPVRIEARTDSKLVGKSVTVKINGVEESGTIEDMGFFAVTLPAQPPGGPHTLEFNVDGTITRCSDVYFGEVWICGGQSNMMFPMNDKLVSPDEIKPAGGDNYPLIRRGGSGGWTKITGGAIASTPGTPYYFARALHRALNRPIGLRIWGAGGSTLWRFVPESVSRRPELEYHYSVMSARNALAQQGNHNYPPAQGFSPYRHPWFEFTLSDLWETGALNARVTARGTIWWQGENDIGAAALYEDLFRAFIQEYRKASGRGNEMPFLYVQLPTYNTDPGNTQQADIKRFGIQGVRDAQRRCLSEPNTAMTVNIDQYGDANVHPSNKVDVGERLSQGALGMVYGKNATWKYPLYTTSSVTANGSMLIGFSDVGTGLRARGGGTAVRGFQVAGNNRVFHPAQATVVGSNSVEVTCSDVPSPVAVRYAWWEVPVADLVGGDNLPASPFRTDNWELYPVGTTGFQQTPLTVNSHLPARQHGVWVDLSPCPAWNTATVGSSWFDLRGRMVLRGLAVSTPMVVKGFAAPRP